MASVVGSQIIFPPALTQAVTLRTLSPPQGAFKAMPPKTDTSGTTWEASYAVSYTHLIVVANLKPAKLCGVESNGMILAADAGENDVRVIFVDESIPCGSVVR